ncbi:hypothetical protein KSP40_PGU021846 [Platanthera guangdongensis]|uniref:Uncharacterized protein n=1 Tax=Platanthera guangdongensis TaxID=2320717 RepID=A0ABR2LD69_9ASPA
MSSRSARRKKTKRIFYRIHGYKKKLIKIQNPESGNQEEPSGYANADQDANVNKDNAPVNPGCHSLDQMSSKSARRKKAKRIFYRTHGYKKKLIKIQNPESGNQEEPSGYANADQDADVNKDNAPVNPDNQSVKKDEPVV